MRIVITFLSIMFVCSVVWAQQGRYISGQTNIMLKKVITILMIL